MGTLFKHRPKPKARLGTRLFAFGSSLMCIGTAFSGDWVVTVFSFATLCFANIADHTERRLQWYEGDI